MDIQPTLFDSEAITLVGGELGEATYHPGFLDTALADTLFACLRDSTSWQSERRQMYDREVAVPRLMARYALPDPQLPPDLAELYRRVSQQLGCTFNSLGLNYYRDGNDSVAPHNDKLHLIVPDHPIAIVSLGGPRRMAIRSKQLPRALVKIDLESGSLLVMNYKLQLHFEHGIAKVRGAARGRISATFRQRPAL